MTIEEIRRHLEKEGLTPDSVQAVIDSIVKIRSLAYAEGWNDAEAEHEMNQ